MGDKATRLIDAQVKGEKYTPKQITKPPAVNNRGTLPYWIKNNPTFVGVLNNRMKLESSLNNLNAINTDKDSGVLYNDITGGIAQKIIRIVNKNIDNREKIKLLREITQNKGFDLLEKNTEKGTSIKVFSTVKNTDIEYIPNKDAAQTLNSIGFDVYMLPKTTNSKSFDYILVNKNNIYAAELKTIYGINSLDNRLYVASTQSDRIVINIVGNATSRYVADEIKDFYQQNPQIKEIIVLKSGKPIYVDYRHANKKNFVKTFMNEWAR